MPRPNLESLIRQNPLLAVSKLMEDTTEIVFPGTQESFPRNRLLKALQNWAAANFPETFNSAYFKPPNFDEDQFPKDVSEQVRRRAAQEDKDSNAPLPEELEKWRIKFEQIENLPQSEQQNWLEFMKTVENKALFKKLEDLKLDDQLKIIQNFQTSLRTQINNELAYLQQKGLIKTIPPPETVNQLVQYFSQNLGAQARLQKEAFTPNHNYFWRVLTRLCDQDAIVNKALPVNSRVELAERLANKADTAACQEIGQAQKNISQAAAAIFSPEKMEQIVSQASRLPEKNVQTLIHRLQIARPSDLRLNPEEIEQRIKECFGFIDEWAMYKEGLSPDRVAKELAPAVQLHYQAMSALLQEQKDKPWRMATSKRAKKLGQKADLDPRLSQMMIAGHSKEEIRRQINFWQKKGLSLEKATALQDQLDKAKLPTRDRLRIIPSWIRKRFKNLGDFFAKLNQSFNPLSLKFWRFRAPRLVENLSFRKRFRGWRKKTWDNFVNNRKSPFWKNFFSHLPDKFKASWWLSRPAYWLRKGASKLLIKLGSRLGKDLLLKAGEFLIKNSFKKLLSRGAAYLLGAVLGIGTGGIGTVLAVAGFPKDVFLTGFALLASPGGQELLKKAGEIFAGLIYSIIKLISTYTFAFAGMFIGGFLGPAGAALGFGIGLFIDTIRLRAGSFLQSLRGVSLSGAPEAGAATAPLTAEAAAAPAAGISPAMAVPASVSLVAGLGMMASASRSSSFISPEGMGPLPSEMETRYLSVNKNANPTRVHGPGAQITYTIEITAGEGGVSDVIITDEFDGTHLTISHPTPAPTSQTGSNMVWDLSQMDLPHDFSQPNSTLSISYTATTLGGVTEDTRISNEVEVTALYEGETINRTDYVVINSACQDVVGTASDIAADLVIGNTAPCRENNPSCYSRAIDESYYPNMYNCPTDMQWTEYTIRSHTCIYCNNLVTAAYRKNGRPDPIVDWGEALVAAWQSQGYNIPIRGGQGDLADVSEGDVILFDVWRTDDRGRRYLDELSHTGLVSRTNPGGIYVWEANSIRNTEFYYGWSAGAFSSDSILVNYIVDSCQE